MGTQILVPLGEHYHLRKRGKTMKRIHSTVLLLGESGTGKEVLSHAIHRWSPRGDQAFVVVSRDKVGA